MTSILVGLEDVLATLDGGAPLSTTQIAREFGLNPLDARILMLHAHVHGLVRRTDCGEWAITHEGRAAVSVSSGELPPPGRRLGTPVRTGTRGLRRPLAGLRLSGLGWLHGWQGGMVVVACVVACAVVAGIPGRFGGSAVQSVASAPYQQAGASVSGHRHVRGRATTRGDRAGAITVERRYETSEITERQSRLLHGTSSVSKLQTPVWVTPVTPETGKGTAGTTQSSLQMGRDRAEPASREGVAAGCGARGDAATRRRPASHCDVASTGRLPAKRH
jgi:hypothetical protein